MYLFSLNSFYRIPQRLPKTAVDDRKCGRLNPALGPASATIPNAEMLFYLQSLTLAYNPGPDFRLRLLG
jgi:hypothetical protein